MYELGIKTNLTSESFTLLKSLLLSPTKMRTVGQSLCRPSEEYGGGEGGWKSRTGIQGLGVDVHGSTDDALKLLVKLISEMEDGAAKTELARKMFGARRAEFPEACRANGRLDGANRAQI